MPWFENIMFAFIVGVAAFAFGLSQQPESFAARFAPALLMQPSMELQHKPRPAAPGFDRSQKETEMRTLEDFKVNPANDLLKVTVLDEPGPGGANHHYMITTPDWTRAPDGSNPKGVWDIQFQNGPIKENGVNGLTQEVLLSIVIDRLRAFQAGPYSSRENALALTKIEEAQHWLLHRTRERMARGVEGTHKV